MNDIDEIVFENENNRALQFLQIKEIVRKQIVNIDSIPNSKHTKRVLHKGNFFHCLFARINNDTF